jgi:NAD(P)-dependent dehydrogenase (short-subunit alcohol dehydrogenase family)
MNQQGTAIVTGAASGMGEATARLMHAAGWHLVLCDLNEDRLRASAAEYAAPNEIAFAIGDISTTAFLAALDTALTGRPIRAVIHCAGISPSMGGPERILEVNLAAPMRILNHILPRMDGNGAIVLFASSSGHMVGTTFDERIGAADSAEKVASLIDLCPNSGIAYTVAKRGVMLLAKREAHRFGKNGVRLVSLSPGIIDTPMGRKEMEHSPIIQALVAGSSLPRAADPSEVGSVAVFLCSPAASFITGTDLLVDGGSLARGVPSATS